ncbi:MAG: tRNA (5-methylaminomethyl-2-thiouridine)(34)-methyltransferase MnmD [Mariniphaga sp.]|nr:tRNA (5-methylaminomethyl-2-thiouridine)(34)-methyltransferase MnmD [Mariniphaga sp.]MDD4224808.1 tRNA (5-methylaminomethyl-2-thiouridine)(34)-methyltransferase MnmD [Mariniphaga sp.]MDD4425640.1 tRNA (5-methylaminomethyl-2-thiouridine)(34)-methyltransferase MnmD [Mariniphaga sp.]
MNLQLKDTIDGSKTFYLPEMNEPYHSLNGAVTESNHVFIHHGLQAQTAAHPVIFEVGFGTGLNCLLTAAWAEREKRNVFYMGVEKFPLENSMLRMLNYESLVSENGTELFSSIHNAEWGCEVQVSTYFRLLKIHADFTRNNLEIPRKYDLVYFDAFGPDKQPEMWTQDLFCWIYKWMQPEGILVTYSAKGEVRRRLTNAGFKMEKIPGPPGKKEMLRGIKMPSKLLLPKN